MQAIEKILGYKSYSVKKKMDALLELDCIIYTNMGTDSTKADKRKAKSDSRKIYKAIANLGEQEPYLWGNSFLMTMDL